LTVQDLRDAFIMTTRDQIAQIHSLLPHMMIRDRQRILRRLRTIPRKPHEVQTLADSIRKSAEASVEERKLRLNTRPIVTYPGDLPILSRRSEIIRLIKENQVVIVSGETGCGKSTQLPKMCLEAGRGISGKIGCTQPRRIAAITIAHRIAQELGEDIGRAVGYKIRFRDRTSPHAFIKIMTDGMLLAETQTDAGLYAYDTLIIDEAHERTLNIDFILGILKRLLPSRPELKVIVTSATLDTEKFSAAFNHAPVVNVTGRLYPIAVEYMPVDPRLEEEGESTYVEMAVEAVDALRRKNRFGDVLIFMPTEEDIRETCELLQGRQYPGTAVLPLFARLPASEQGRVYSVTGSKIVVATNVAETSLTIPGIKYVIDTGLARIPRYHPRTRTTSLAVGPISQSSADQRKGRCGRVQNGVCIRLYPEEDYDSRPLFTLPEIQRSNLAEVILRMLSLKLGHPSAFPFLDPPGARAIKDGFDLLTELGALRKEGQSYALTAKGKLMAKMPMDPQISRMMIEAVKEGCLKETAVIASALSIQDPRERPVEKALQADQMQAPFKDPHSDFLSLLNIWTRYHREWETLKTQNQMRKFCKQHFLSYSRMREWVYTHEQITAILKEQKITENQQGKSSAYDRIHRSILSGFLSNIALKKERNMYLAARGREVMLYPGSTLFNKAPGWIVAAEIVKTSRLFARTAGTIDSAWLEDLGGDLCRSSFSDPFWDKHRGEVRAFEQVSLFGLVIVARRPVSYGRINPQESHGIFVRSALVEANLIKPPPFVTYNKKLVEKLTAVENKLRRRDILAGDEAVVDFYSERLKGVYDLPTLNQAIKEQGGDTFLRLRDQDLLLTRPDEAEIALYPDKIDMGEMAYPCLYAFAPGKEQDGVTLKVPSGQVSRIPAARVDWIVPGLLREKVTALVRALPKRYRKQFVPLSRSVDIILREMEQGDQTLISALASFVHRRFGVDIPASVWTTLDLPEHLSMRISVVDHSGNELESGRDLCLLRQSDDLRKGDDSLSAWKKGRERWEKRGITRWDFGPLPESIPLGERLIAYPGLEAVNEGVNLLLFQNQEQARASHKQGVKWLLARHFARDLKYLRRNLTLPKGAAPGAGHFGGTAAVEQRMYERLMAQLFEKDLRSPEELERYIQKVAPVLLEKGNALRDLMVRILDAYQPVQTALLSLKGSKGQHLELCLRLREELDELIPEDFFERYDPDRLSHLPRYLKAMQIRAERGTNDPEKHRIKTMQVDQLIRGIKGFKETLSPQASTEKREAVETFRWMIEEFKVSLFAQELKTPFPISRKRLEEIRKKIERMA
jgi:ATP-dependent helicase HrpA